MKEVASRVYRLGSHWVNFSQGSLERFEGLEAETVLFGHGDPWTDGVKSAIERAATS